MRISHKVIYDKEKQLRVACAYCKDTVIPDSASQGVSNFKGHTEIKSPKNKRSAYHALEPLEDIVCREVVSTLDSSIFQILKSGKAFCKPCNHPEKQDSSAH